MRMNNIDRARRTCGAQDGGVACSIVLWIKLLTDDILPDILVYRILMNIRLSVVPTCV